MIDLEVTLFEIRDHVAWITLNRPASLNAINTRMRWELSEIFNEVEANDDIWLAVLTGAGERAFSAGADLKERALEREASEEQKAEWDRMKDQTHPMVERWYCPKPVIAMVNGFALGGGLELALACDIIVAADHAELGLPEARRGLYPGSGGAVRLPRQIPIKVAMGYLMTGRHMSAERAYELGLVTQLVPGPSLRETVEQEWIPDILRCSPVAIRAIKESAMRGLDMALPQAYYSENDSYRKWEISGHRTEGPRAFAEKRAPDWTIS